MPTLTTHADPSGASASTLPVALDLGNRSWCLACAPAVSEAPRVRVFPARTLARLFAELATARQHFGLAPNAPVVLCYEAGRDGFWFQRACAAAGVTAFVVDSSSIEGPGAHGEPKPTRLTLVQQQRRALVKARRAQLETSTDPAVHMVRQVLRLRGIGEVSAWLFTMELFSWRRFCNAR